MDISDDKYFSKFSHELDDDPFIEADYFKDLELDGEFNGFMDVTDFDQTGDIFWDDF